MIRVYYENSQEGKKHPLFYDKDENISIEQTKAV